MAVATTPVRFVLARNLKELMRRTPSLDSGPKIAAASKGAIAQSTVSRITTSKVGASVDHLDVLAKLFDVEPWVLVHPNLKFALAQCKMYEAMRSELKATKL